MKILAILIIGAILGTNEGRFVKSPYIEGGEKVKTGDIPYQVFITSVLNATGDVERECSGSLISPDTVLTSALCVWNVRLGNVVVGEVDIDNLSSSQTADVLVIESIYIHEDFDPETLDHNIALVTLDRPVRFKEKIIQVIDLASGDDDYTNEVGVISGWGGKGQLSKGEGTVLSELACKVRYNNLREGQFCAANNEQAPCSGDEGAPLVLEDEDGSKVQIGVYSFIRDGNCSYKWPAVYTKVADYQKWIEKNLKIQFS